jgi:hypothetical protein
MNNDYLWDRTGDPDTEVQQLEEVLGTLRYQPQPFVLPAAIEPAPRRRFSQALAIAATIAFMILAGGIWLKLHRQQISSSDNISKSRIEGNVQLPRAVPSSTATPVETVKLSDRDSVDLVMQRNPSVQKNRAARHSNRSYSRVTIVTAAQRAEGEAAKDQLMLALRVVSAKLNLAQRKTQSIPANYIRNQHKVG